MSITESVIADLPYRRLLGAKLQGKVIGDAEFPNRGEFTRQSASESLSKQD